MINSQSKSFQKLNPHLYGVPQVASGGTVEKLEMPLHDRIMKHCEAQWPRWKYIRARPDIASTIAKGAQDFTIFLPRGITVCIECKSATGKLDDDQRSWAKEMQMLGHTVHEVRSFDHFLTIINL